MTNPAHPEPVSLELDGVSKFYGPVQALEPLDLTVAPGELLSLLGPSGCGKTTTLRIIAGFETPDYGYVRIGGRDVTDLAPNHRHLGMMFQSYGLFPHMTVAENIGFGLRMRGVNAADRARKVAEMLATVKLGAFGDRMIHQLSGGQQQRVALARSLVTNPSVLLLDEPLGALDKNLREQMQFELRDIQRRLGITTILVTHDQEEALTMSDRIAVMRAGRVVQIGSPFDIYKKPATRFISEFLGTSNILGADLLHKGTDGRAKARLELNGCEVELNDSQTTAQSGERIEIAVRPEAFRLAPQGQGNISGILQDVVFRGSYFACEILVSGREEPLFVYSQSNEHIPSPGSSIEIAWPRDGAVVLGGQP